MYWKGYSLYKSIGRLLDWLVLRGLTRFVATGGLLVEARTAVRTHLEP